MRVIIAGGHGSIARLLARRLVGAGHEAVGLIRNPDHASDLRDDGAESVVVDLERASAPELAAALAGADAVVFAAGAGPGSGAPRKLTLDRDGAILLAEAAGLAGVRRYLLVSAMSADRFDPAAAAVDPESADESQVFQIYLRAKAEADAAVRATDLDWTIVRPGSLTDDPGSGRVAVGTELAKGRVPRADVAHVLAALLEGGGGSRTQFDLVGGDTPVDAALAAL